MIDRANRFRTRWPEIATAFKAPLAAALQTSRPRRPEEELELERKLALSRRMETVGETASGMAHNFNNIIGAIAGFGATANLYAEPGSTIATNLAEIQVAVRRAQALVQDVLDPRRRLDAPPANVDIGQLLSETATLLVASLPADVALRIDNACLAELVKGSFGPLQQVLLNLCNNAADAMPHGGMIQCLCDQISNKEPRRLSHAILPAGDYITISVRDGGSGIAADVLPRLFDPFFTTRANGTGLGLSTAREIIKEHDGAIDVTSAPGQGSCFTVWLPLQIAMEPLSTPAFIPGSGETVLLVNLNVADRAMDEEIVAALGYEPRGLDDPALIDDFQGLVDAVIIAGFDPQAVKAAASSLPPAQWRAPVLIATSEPSPSDPLALHYPLRPADLAVVLSRLLPPSRGWQVGRRDEQPEHKPLERSAGIASMSWRPGFDVSIAPSKGQQVDLAPGRVLNGIYRVNGILARGGMGDVYAGVNIESGEQVAIKALSPHLTADVKTLALLRNKARLLTHVVHPAVVPYRVFARDPALNIHYIVTDFIEGGVLSDRITGVPADQRDLMRLLRRLAEGLNAIHAAGAIHCDMTPDNVMLPGGRIDASKIMDLGIVESLYTPNATAVTPEFSNKLGYIAPEQFGINQWAIGPWTDIYSTALVTLAFARGRAVDMGDTLGEAIARRQLIPPLDDLSKTLAPLLRDMLAPDPARRLGSLGQVLDALDSLDGRPPPAIQTSEQFIAVEPRKLPCVTTAASRRRGLTLGSFARARTGLMLAHPTRRRMRVARVGRTTVAYAVLMTAIMLTTDAPILQNAPQGLPVWNHARRAVEYQTPSPILARDAGIGLQFVGADVQIASNSSSIPDSMRGDAGLQLRKRSAGMAPEVAPHMRRSLMVRPSRAQVPTPMLQNVDVALTTTAVCRRFNGKRWKVVATTTASLCVQRGFAERTTTYVQFGAHVLSRRDNRIGVVEQGRWWPIADLKGSPLGSRNDGGVTKPLLDGLSGIGGQHDDGRALLTSTAKAICRRFDGERWRDVATTTASHCVQRGFVELNASYVQFGVNVLSRHNDRIGMVEQGRWQSIANLDPGSGVSRNNVGAASFSPEGSSPIGGLRDDGSAILTSTMTAICRRFDGERWRDVATTTASLCVQRGFAERTAAYMQFGPYVLSRRDDRIGMVQQGRWRAIADLSGVRNNADTAKSPPDSPSWIGGQRNGWGAILISTTTAVCRRFDGERWRDVGTMTANDCVKRAFTEPGTGHAQSGTFILSRHANRVGVMDGRIWRPIATITESSADQHVSLHIL